MLDETLEATELEAAGEISGFLPPTQNHLVQLLPQSLHVGIGKASVQRADAVGLRQNCY
jgi:hypothetical protein